MTLLVRDEVDIVQCNIEFHLRMGVDFIIATDNGSRDGTREILEKYREKGVLHLIDEGRHDMSQAEWVNRMGSIACEQYGADVIFHCDADELWLPKSGNLKHEILKRSENILSVHVKQVLLIDKNGEERFPEDSRFVVTKPIDIMDDFQSNNFLLYRALPKVIFKSDKIKFEVSMGNHSVTNALPENSVGVSQDIVIYHFLLRNKQQFFRKVVNAGSALERNPQLDQRISFHVRHWYDQYKKGLLEGEYHKMLVSYCDVQYLLRLGHIQCIDIQSIMHGGRSNIGDWMLYHQNVKSKFTLHCKENRRLLSNFILYDLVRNLQPELMIMLGGGRSDCVHSACQAARDSSLAMELCLVDPCLNDKFVEINGKSFRTELDDIVGQYGQAINIHWLAKGCDKIDEDFVESSIDILQVVGFEFMDSVINDFQRWLTKIKHGGCIVLNNFYFRYHGISCQYFRDMVLRQNKNVKWIESHGLVICFKDGEIYRKFNDWREPSVLYYLDVLDNEKSGYIIDDIDDVIGDYGYKKEQVFSLERQLWAAHDEIKRMNHEINILCNSVSWRVTAPLRLFKQYFPRLCAWIRRFMVQ